MQRRTRSSQASLPSTASFSMHGRVGGSANLESMDVELVSGNYFSVLSVKPMLGHGLTKAEDEPAGGHPVAMVRYSWWKRRLWRAEGSGNAVWRNQCYGAQKEPCPGNPIHRPARVRATVIRGRTKFCGPSSRDAGACALRREDR